MRGSVLEFVVLPLASLVLKYHFKDQTSDVEAECEKARSLGPQVGVHVEIGLLWLDTALLNVSVEVVDLVCFQG